MRVRLDKVMRYSDIVGARLPMRHTESETPHEPLRTNSNDAGTFHLEKTTAQPYPHILKSLRGERSCNNRAQAVDSVTEILHYWGSHLSN